MTQFLQLRSGPSGAPFVGENDLDTLLWDAARKAWYVGPGGSVPSEPIQNVRFLDERFTGTSNGAIARPWKLFSEFFAELGAVSQGWLLTLPGIGVTPDGPLPDVTTVRSIAFEGVDRLTSQISDLTIETQSGNPNFAFRKVGVPGTITIGNGSMILDFVDVDVSAAIPSSNAFFAPIRIVDSHFTFAAFAGVAGSTFATNSILHMYGGDVSGQVSFGGGQFFNVEFGAGVTIIPTNGEETTRFVGCRFGSGVTIDNTWAPAIEMDTYSNATFIAGGGTFAGVITVVG